MSIHEHLPREVRKDLKEIVWTKGRELAKVVRRDGQHFDCAPWVHKARSMPREDFRREVEKELTEREEEPSELIYFKVYALRWHIIGWFRTRGFCVYPEPSQVNLGGAGLPLSTRPNLAREGPLSVSSFSIARAE
jgi:hypothetical protein